MLLCSSVAIVCCAVMCYAALCCAVLRDIMDWCLDNQQQIVTWSTQETGKVGAYAVMLCSDVMVLYFDAVFLPKPTLIYLVDSDGGNAGRDYDDVREDPKTILTPH